MPVWSHRLNGISIWPYRLRGGADRQSTNEANIEQSLLNLEESISPMVKKAIQNAEIHWILYHGVRNLANSDCAFENYFQNWKLFSIFILIFLIFILKIIFNFENNYFQNWKLFSKLKFVIYFSFSKLKIMFKIFFNFENYFQE